MEIRDQLIEKVENILSDSDIPLEDKEFWLRFLYSAPDNQVLMFVDVFENNQGLFVVANDLFKAKFEGFGDPKKMKNILDLEKSFLAEMLEK